MRKIPRTNLYTFIFMLLLGFVVAGCNTSLKKESTTNTVRLNREIILATTTSVQDSGLLEEILPQFTKKTGIKIKPIAVGSGEALKMGMRGDADIILAHSPEGEKGMVESGLAKKRTEFMHNYFAIVGPKNDPAKVKDADSAEDGFRKIVQASELFISRGDESGTNKKELKIWDAASVKYERKNYVKTGQGMGSTLQVANEKGGYTLTDKATFISNEKNLTRLSILLTEKDALKNTYSIIELNPKKVKFNEDGAKKFKDWILSKTTLRRISVYGKEKFGEPLFLINRF